MKRNHLLLTSMILVVSAALHSGPLGARVATKKQKPLIGQPKGKGQRRGKIMRAFGLPRSTHWKPNGLKECARRVAQREAGTMTPNYVHGNQYLT